MSQRRFGDADARSSNFAGAAGAFGVGGFGTVGSLVLFLHTYPDIARAVFKRLGIVDSKSCAEVLRKLFKHYTTHFWNPNLGPVPNCAEGKDEMDCIAAEVKRIVENKLVVTPEAAKQLRVQFSLGNVNPQLDLEPIVNHIQNNLRNIRTVSAQENLYESLIRSELVGRGISDPADFEKLNQVLFPGQGSIAEKATRFKTETAKEIADLKTQIASLQNKNNDLELKVALPQNVTASVTSDAKEEAIKQQLALQRVNYETTLSKQETENEQLKVEKDQLRNDLQEKQKLLDKLQNQTNQQSLEKQLAIAERESLEKQLTTLQAQTQILQRETDEQKRTNAQLNVEIALKDAQLNANKEKATAAELKFMNDAELQTRLNIALAANTSLTREAQDLELRFNALTTRCQQLEQAHTTMQTKDTLEVANLRETITQLQQQLEQTRRTNEAQRVQFEQEKKTLNEQHKRFEDQFQKQLEQTRRINEAQRVQFEQEKTTLNEQHQRFEAQFRAKCEQLLRDQECCAELESYQMGRKKHKPTVNPQLVEEKKPL
jgi:hypothetical protein